MRQIIPPYHRVVLNSHPICLGYDGSVKTLSSTVDGNRMPGSRPAFHIQDSEYYVIFNWQIDVSSPKLYHLDGRTVPIPYKSGISPIASGLIERGNLSQNHRYLFLSTNSSFIVIDMLALEVIFAKEGLPYNVWGGYRGDTNADGTKVYTGTYKPAPYVKVQCWDVATGNLSWETSNTYKALRIYHRPEDDTLWVYTDDSHIVHLDATGAVISDNGLSSGGTPSSSRWDSRSPDGRYLTLGGYNTKCFYDIVNETQEDIGVRWNSTGNWLDDNKYAMAEYTFNAMYEIDFTTKTSKMYQTINNGTYYKNEDILIVGRHGKYKITIPITDNAEETTFETLAYFDGALVGKDTLTSPNGNVDINVSVSRPVDVIVRGIPRPEVLRDSTYGVGAIISANDTNYTYECTTAGTTDSIKPVYPTSGTVTDGTAVFTVRSKIAKSVRHTHVVPVPV